MAKSGKTKVIVLIAVVLFTIFILTQAADSRSVMRVDPVKNFVKRCSFFSPVKHRNLTIIPVRGPVDSSRSSGIQTLDEAISGGNLVVKEVSRSGSVNKLAVINNSSKSVFIMAGEIMRGSKQDRVLKSDVLIPPKSGKILVDAYCVEQGRWTYKSDKFYSQNQAANISVRQAAKQRRSQSAVWDSVAETNKSFKAAPSGSLSESYEAPAVKRDKKEYKREIIDVPGQYPKANGVVVLVNGRVLVADIFMDNKMFKKMWPKLADSYILEAMSRNNRKVYSDFTSASEFLAEVQDASINYSRAPGSGKHIDISSTNITGSGVLTNNTPLHLDIFPNNKNYKKEYSPIQRNYQNNPIRQQEVTPER